MSGIYKANNQSIKPPVINVKRVKATPFSQIKSPIIKDEQAELTEKYKRSQKDAMAKSLMCDDRLSHIKSIGNGL